MPVSTLAPPESGRPQRTTAARANTWPSNRAARSSRFQVLKVREIMGIQDITAVPQTPLFVKGVINLQGQVIPVIDLRLKFGLPEAAYTQRTCIIVVQVRGPAGVSLTGIVVEEVSEAVNIIRGEIEDTPGSGTAVPRPYILGVAKSKGKVKILPYIDKVLELDATQASMR